MDKTWNLLRSLNCAVQNDSIGRGAKIFRAKTKLTATLKEVEKKNNKTQQDNSTKRQNYVGIGPENCCGLKQEEILSPCKYCVPGNVSITSCIC